jgi:hypothetical protein
MKLQGSGPLKLPISAISNVSGFGKRLGAQSLRALFTDDFVVEVVKAARFFPKLPPDAFRLFTARENGHLAIEPMRARAPPILSSSADEGKITFN